MSPSRPARDGLGCCCSPYLSQIATDGIEMPYNALLSFRSPRGQLGNPYAHRPQSQVTPLMCGVAQTVEMLENSMDPCP